jgi:hypothetical protein
MPAYKWWTSWGGTLPELCELAIRVLAQPVVAGDGERSREELVHLLFYCGQEEELLPVDCGRKLVYAHFNVRLLRMVCAVEYHSEYLAWEDEDEVEIDTEVLEVEDEVAE